jgi:kynurenine formamidase
MDEGVVNVPSFEDLPTLPGTTERHAWDVWGRSDEIGTMNFIGPAEVVAASKLVHDGTVISLSAPLDQPAPGLFPERRPYEHIVERRSHGRDDRVDGLYLQFSSQWDGLRHVRYRGFGYWGGRDEADLDDRGELGIERWAERGIIGRGVLVDVASHLGSRDGEFPPDRRYAISPRDLDETLAAQGTVVRPGDIVIIRTGWLEWYLGLSASERDALVGTVGRPTDPLACPGLDAAPETAAWLWNHRVAAIASDNSALEALPVIREVGFLHYRLIPMLGMPIGEFWSVALLAEHCRALQRYEFMVTSGPLNLPGGVGSPTNAYAIF